MKKGKIILAAAALGALISMAWLTAGRKQPEPAKPVSAPQLQPPLVAKPAPSERRMAARKAVRANPSRALAKAESKATTHAEKEIPLPAGWNGHFTRQNLQARTRDCDIDRPCSPRGRDGVLLVGASFALNGLMPGMPQILSVGSYEQRTPLLVYK